MNELMEGLLDIQLISNEKKVGKAIQNQQKQIPFLVKTTLPLFFFVQLKKNKTKKNCITTKPHHRLRVLGPNKSIWVMILAGKKT